MEKRISKEKKDFITIENKRIGSNLLKLRWNQYLEQVDLTQKIQLAGLDIDKVTYCKIENGNRKLYAYEIPYFAKALNMSINQFVEKIFEK